MHTGLLTSFSLGPIMPSATFPSPLNTFFFLLEYNCFTMLFQFLMYNKVNQLYMYIYEPPSPHPIPNPQGITGYLAKLPVLYNNFPLAILHIVVLYMSMLFSQFIPHFILLTPLLLPKHRKPNSAIQFIWRKPGFCVYLKISFNQDRMNQKACVWCWGDSRVG